MLVDALVAGEEAAEIVVGIVGVALGLIGIWVVG